MDASIDRAAADRVFLEFRCCGYCSIVIERFARILAGTDQGSWLTLTEAVVDLVLPGKIRPGRDPLVRTAASMQSAQLTLCAFMTFDCES